MPRLLIKKSDLSQNSVEPSYYVEKKCTSVVLQVELTHVLNTAGIRDRIGSKQ